MLADFSTYAQILDAYVIHLYYYEEMSVDEISAVLNTKPATIRSRLARGRERLKRELTQNKEANPNA